MNGRTHRSARLARGLTWAACGAATASTALLTASALGFNRVLVALAVTVALLTGASFAEHVADRHRDGRDLVRDRATSTVTPETARPSGVPEALPPSPTSTRAAPHPQPASECSGGWVDVGDLLGDERIHQLQCGGCASYDVRLSRSVPRSLVCGRCGSRTALHPDGSPHAIRVRSRIAAGVITEIQIDNQTRPSQQEAPR